MYFTIQEVLNDCLGAPMCTGTGYVARRSAIAEIGGWPLAYAGEDYMCSALLTGAGWEVVFAREPLQAGLAPESMRALTTQRMRWVRFCLAIVLILLFFRLLLCIFLLLYCIFDLNVVFQCDLNLNLAIAQCRS